MKEFKPTHKWKQYPNIEFEIQMDVMKVRVKGKMDMNPTGYLKITEDQNGILYFSVKRERIYEWDWEMI